MNLSEGKRRRLAALANERGVIAAAAMDQRGSLRNAMAAAEGSEPDAISDQMMAEFKTAVARVLTPHASAILLDPELGLEAAKARSAGAGLLLAYEQTGYDTRTPGRLPQLIEHVSARRIAAWGADGLKVLIHYTPFEKPEINDVKHALVERVGAECAALDLPFFLEFVGYDAQGGDEKGVAYARLKPEIVARGMEEFSKPQYQVDVLKVEIPVNTRYVEGCAACRGEAAYSRAEALDHFRRAAAAAAVKPFIYLSAGVGNPQFVESLRLAGEAGVDFSGVLCGRATWKEGIPVYVEHGVRALEDWLADQGVRNIEAVNDAIRNAQPWYAKLGLPAAA